VITFQRSHLLKITKLKYKKTVYVNFVTFGLAIVITLRDFYCIFLIDNNKRNKPKPRKIVDNNKCEHALR